MSDLKKKKRLIVPDNCPAVVRWPPITSESGIDKLTTAVLLNDERRVKELVTKGVHPDTRNADGQTPLFIAAILGKKGVVSTLLRLGANPNCRCVPEGHTPLHGACFIGCAEIIKRLILAGGDLRLCDTKREKPVDWIEYQGNIKKRKTTQELIEKIRFCAMKSKREDMMSEFKSKVEPVGVSFPMRLWNWFKKCGGGGGDAILEDLFPDQLLPTGFGEGYFGSGEKCSGVIGLPCLFENLDLKLDTNPNTLSPSWICGRFTTFVPMVWKDTAVTCRTLRHKSVEEAVPDILISELSVLRRLIHANFLLVMGICQEDNFDSLSLVFEEIQVGSLYFVLHQKNLRMKSVVAADIIIQVAEALDYMHASGLLHCGISSHAIMLVTENRAKLGCFEYAMPEDKTQAEMFNASRHPWLQSDSHLSVIRHWTAPEVLIGSSSHTRATDVYALCSVMWELIVGEVPWKDFELSGLKLLLKQSPGLQLQLRKDVIPPLWYSILQVGLRRKERDLDIKEIRYMMSLVRQASVTNSTTGTAERKAASRSSLRTALSGNSNPSSSGKRPGSAPSRIRINDQHEVLKYNEQGEGDCPVLRPKSAVLGLDVVDDTEDVKPDLSSNELNPTTSKSFKSEAFIRV